MGPRSASMLNSAPSPSPPPAMAAVAAAPGYPLPHMVNTGHPRGPTLIPGIRPTFGMRHPAASGGTASPSQRAILAHLVCRHPAGRIALGRPLRGRTGRRRARSPRCRRVRARDLGYVGLADGRGFPPATPRAGSGWPYGRGKSPRPGRSPPDHRAKGPHLREKCALWLPYLYTRAAAARPHAESAWGSAPSPDAPEPPTRRPPPFPLGPQFTIPFGECALWPYPLSPPLLRSGNLDLPDSPPERRPRSHGFHPVSSPKGRNKTLEGRRPGARHFALRATNWRVGSAQVAHSVRTH